MDKKDSRKLSERIRSYVEDPESTGQLHYGEWGALRPEQRRLIRQLCDECDAFERDADRFYTENERLAKERDLANAEREANVKGFTKQIEEMSVELQAMRNAANAYKKRSEELEKDLTARRLMAEMHRTTVEEVKAEGINAMADKLIGFYQKLPGKTVGGSVAYHVEVIRSELLKEVLE